MVRSTHHRAHVYVVFSTPLLTRPCFAQYLPQHPILGHSEPMFSPTVCTTRFMYMGSCNSEELRLIQMVCATSGFRLSYYYSRTNKTVLMYPQGYSSHTQVYVCSM
jgi:hypothetical protein